MTNSAFPRRAGAKMSRALPDAKGPGRVLAATDRIERFTGADRLLAQVRRASGRCPGAGP